MKLFSYDMASALMSKANIDMVLANTKTNVGYLANYYSHFMNEDFILDDGSMQYISFVGLPKEENKEPFFTPNAQDGEDLIEQDIWIKDLRFYGPYVDYSYIKDGPRTQKVKDNCVDCVVEAIIDRDLEGGIIGVEMMRIPAGIFFELKKKLPKADFVDGSGVLRQLRMIKSKEEVLRIKRAAEMTDKAMETAFNNLKVGMTELECERILKKDLAESGGDFIWDHVAFGPKSISLPTEKNIDKGETARIDFGGGYKDYICDTCRTKVLGQPDTEIIEIHNAVLRTLEAIKEEINPSVKCSYLYNLGKIEMEEHGYKLFLPYVGHGVGRDLHEMPFLTEHNDDMLAPGMVITIEIYIVNEDWTVAINLEDQLLVTENGYEDFNFLNKDLELFSN